jgi:hypothetical protein
MFRLFLFQGVFCPDSFFIWYIKLILFRHSPLRLRLLSNVVQISSQQLNTLNVVALIELLVNRVSTIRGATHRQQEHILARSLLESKGNRDAGNCVSSDTPSSDSMIDLPSTLTSVIRLDAPYTLNSLGGG